MCGWWRFGGPAEVPDDMALREFSRTASRLTEMQTLHYLQQLHQLQRITLGGDA